MSNTLTRTIGTAALIALCLAVAPEVAITLIAVAGTVGMFALLGYNAYKGVKDIYNFFKPKKVSSLINWKGDTNHILKGSNGNHIPGWKKFGINPNGDGNKAWAALLPILKEVVDKGKQYLTETLPKGGGTVIYYSKYYAKQGVEVIVKIWVSADGAITKISDAWNNIK